MDIAAQITSVRHGEIRGWAFDRAEPNRVLEVELYADGARLGSAETCPRHDTDEAVPGAFRLEAEAAPLKIPYTIRLGVAVQPDLVLDTYQVSSSTQHDMAMRRYDGEIVGIRDGAILGWVRDLLFPDQAVALEFQLVGGARGVLDTRLETQDGAPRFWFSFALPKDVLDARPHAFIAQVAGAGVLLKGSPYTFALTANDNLDQRLEALEEKLQSLSRLEERVVDQVTCLAKEIVERSDAMMLLCRSNIERDLSAIRRLLGPEQATSENISETRAAEVVFDARLIGIGWLEPEVIENGTPFRWMSNAASVLVEMSMRQPSELVLKGVAFLEEQHLEALRLFIDDEEMKLDKHVIAIGGWQARCAVPARPFCVSPFLTLKFVTQGARSPGNGDGRLLSLSFSSISMTSIVDAGKLAEA